MKVLLSGASPDRQRLAEAAMRATLSLIPGGDELTVVAHRLPNGQWSLFIFDGHTIEVTDPVLAERLLTILSDS